MSASRVSDEGLLVFMKLRPRLLAIVCRVLGSAPEAEDLLQEVWIRWQTTDRAQVRNPVAFLITAATRLAINVRRSARVCREAPAGTLELEPAHADDDPALTAERRDTLSAALRLLLARLSATECAAYVLREAFSYSYREIAVIIGVTEANARQLVTRARKHVSVERREPVSAAEHQRFLLHFTAAASAGRLSNLERLFASNCGRLGEHIPTQSRANVPIGATL